ncbi:hypothetical protein BJ684DRAFT_16119 [Piptocephalis cylindrospora]|uniref:Late embryogenesis abundant protein LEA-2 subgroup domain-containing protein n=1 Tax=Piptocephalis cylindrospora TaxID=1907219 RepID=A0A4P9Y3T4_9FUNG|nr:hypothetical protein BJ684DRAFT_16119 [Piptocephalis cylindrospora]|eukprot:RKP13483.1 hypothetical protein BJ684DRAFT_16119 [Piptocephalis cylindrospora]
MAYRYRGPPSRSPSPPPRFGEGGRGRRARGMSEDSDTDLEDMYGMAGRRVRNGWEDQDTRGFGRGRRQPSPSPPGSPVRRVDPLERRRSRSLTRGRFGRGLPRSPSPVPYRGRRSSSASSAFSYYRQAGDGGGNGNGNKGNGGGSEDKGGGGIWGYLGYGKGDEVKQGASSDRGVNLRREESQRQRNLRRRSSYPVGGKMTNPETGGPAGGGIWGMFGKLGGGGQTDGTKKNDWGFGSKPGSEPAPSPEEGRVGLRNRRRSSHTRPTPGPLERTGTGRGMARRRSSSGMGAYRGNPTSPRGRYGGGPGRGGGGGGGTGWDGGMRRRSSTRIQIPGRGDEDYRGGPASPPIHYTTLNNMNNRPGRMGGEETGVTDGGWMGKFQAGFQGIKGRLGVGESKEDGSDVVYHRPPPPPPPPPSMPQRPPSSAAYVSPLTDSMNGSGKGKVQGGGRKWWGGKSEDAGWKKKLFCCCCLCCGCFCLRPMRRRNRIICLVLGFLLIGALAAMIYVLWPRYPEVVLVGAKPGKPGSRMEPRVTGSILTLPVNLSFVAQSPNYIPFQVGNITVTGYTLPQGQTSPVEIGTGGLARGISLAARALTPFSLPFVLSYDFGHPGGAAAAKEAMAVCVSSSAKLPLSYRADISLPLTDWTGKHPSISGKFDVTCPFTASSLAAIPGLIQLMGGIGAEAGAGAGTGAGTGSDDVIVGSVPLAPGGGGAAASSGTAAGARAGGASVGGASSATSARAPASAPRAAAPAAGSRRRR